MDARQKPHVKMLITTRDLLDKFKSLWQGIVAFATARDDFGTAITNIQDEELAQSDTTTGGTADKHTAREIMCSAAAIVAGAVADYAETQGDHELFAKVDFSLADLLHQAEQDCATHCQGILDAATESLAAMSAGKTLAQTDLDNLDEKIGDFNTALTRPRQIRTKISGATGQLPGLISAADRILERRLDRLMERFRESNPDFYAAYRVARVIVDAGAHPGPAAPPTPPPPQGK